MHTAMLTSWILAQPKHQKRNSAQIKKSLLACPKKRGKKKKRERNNPIHFENADIKETGSIRNRINTIEKFRLQTIASKYKNDCN